MSFRDPKFHPVPGDLFKSPPYVACWCSAGRETGYQQSRFMGQIVVLVVRAKVNWRDYADGGGVTLLDATGNVLGISAYQLREFTPLFPRNP